ncbi:TLE3, partial [Branchiostoma lanceolatum]
MTNEDCLSTGDSDFRLANQARLYPQNRHPAPPHQPGQPFKFTIPESCDRIKEEFSFLQAQYHSLKMEYEKLAAEKTELQRHYVMVNSFLSSVTWGFLGWDDRYYEMSYGLNVEMHKQTEIAKRLNAICAQVIPFLSQEHQQQVATAVERAKQVTMTELNAIIGKQAGFPHFLQQQLQAQHLHQPHAPPVPMPPHPAGLQPPGLPQGSGSGLLALSNALGSAPHPLKDEKPGEPSRQNSLSPSDRDRSDREKFRTPDHVNDRDKNASSSSSKRKRDEKDSGVSKMKKKTQNQRQVLTVKVRKSDDNLVVDVSNEDPPSPRNDETHSPRENGLISHVLRRRSDQKAPTVLLAAVAHLHLGKTRRLRSLPHRCRSPPSPTPSGSATPGASGHSGKPMGKAPPIGTISPALRTPMSTMAMPYSSPMMHMAHADLTSPSAYSNSLMHNSISPQFNNAYGRNPMVRSGIASDQGCLQLEI